MRRSRADEAERCTAPFAPIGGRQKQQQSAQSEGGEARDEHSGAHRDGRGRDEKASTEKSRAPTPRGAVGVQEHDVVDRRMPLVDNDRGPGWRAALHASAHALMNAIRNLRLRASRRPAMRKLATPAGHAGGTPIRQMSRPIAMSFRVIRARRSLGSPARHARRAPARAGGLRAGTTGPPTAVRVEHGPPRRDRVIRRSRVATGSGVMRVCGSLPWERLHRVPRNRPVAGSRRPSNRSRRLTTDQGSAKPGGIREEH